MRACGIYFIWFRVRAHVRVLYFMTELDFQRQSMLQTADQNFQKYMANVAQKNVLDQIEANNSWSAEQAQKQMDFQERMSNTQMQRQVADLKAAGLNPVLAANNGASSPSGAMATADPSATSAIASIMSKVLDIANDNAKAQLVATQSEANYKGSSFGSGYGSYGTTGKDITGYDLNGLLGLLGIKLPNSGANLLATLWNGFKNLNVKEVSNTIDNASRAVAEAIDSKLPPKGTSAYNAYEYKQKTGSSSTEKGLTVLQKAVNKVSSWLKGKK